METTNPDNLSSAELAVKRFNEMRTHLFQLSQAVGDEKTRVSGTVARQPLYLAERIIDQAESMINLASEAYHRGIDLLEIENLKNGN